MRKYMSRCAQFVMLTFTLMILTACSGGASINTTSSNQPGNFDQGGKNPPVPTPASDFAYEPLVWEKSAAWTKSWSDHLYNTILTKTPELLNGTTDDMTNFCPNYPNLNTSQKINFWGMLISAMAKYESGLDPLARLQETTMGRDPVTGLPVFSEGLLQLSYQDIRSYSFCNFDWNSDKNLSPTDPRKTILDPFRNLDCGVQILSSKVVKHKIIAVPARYAYWSVLIPGGKSTRLPNIQNITKTMSFCQ